MVLHECASQQPPNGRRRVGGEARPVGFSLENVRQRLRQIVSVERTPAGQHFIEDAAERPDVGTPIDGPTTRLFRRHVRGRPQNDALLRHRRRRNRGGVGEAGLSRQSCALSRVERFRQSEVEHLDGAVVSHLDVRRFQVTVNDSLVVSRAHRLGDLLRNGDRLVDWNRTERDAVRQRRTLHQFHDEGGHAVGAFEPVDRGDVRMIQRSQEFGFTLKARETFGVGNQRLGENLHGHGALEATVSGAIDLAHAALADECNHFICAEAGAGCERHVGIGGIIATHRFLTDFEVPRAPL